MTNIETPRECWLCGSTAIEGAPRSAYSHRCADCGNQFNWHGERQTPEASRMRASDGDVSQVRMEQWHARCPHVSDADEPCAVCQPETPEASGEAERLAAGWEAERNEKRQWEAEHLKWRQRAETAEADLAALRAAAAFPRNALICDSNGFKGEWVAVPREDFENLRAALSGARQDGGQK